MVSRLPPAACATARDSRACECYRLHWSTVLADEREASTRGKARRFAFALLSSVFQVVSNNINGQQRELKTPSAQTAHTRWRPWWHRAQTASRTPLTCWRLRGASGDAVTARQAPKVVFVFLKAQRLPRLRGSARPGRAAAAARARPTQPRGPRKTARTHQHTRWRTRRDSENLAAAARRPELARARGHVAAAVRATHQKHITPKDRTHAPTRRDSEPDKNAGPLPCNGTSPASPRTTTTSTSSSATARRRSCATTRSRAASKNYATAWTPSTSSRTF